MDDYSLTKQEVVPSDIIALDLHSVVACVTDSRRVHHNPGIVYLCDSASGEGRQCYEVTVAYHGDQFFRQTVVQPLDVRYHVTRGQLVLPGESDADTSTQEEFVAILDSAEPAS